MIDDFEDVDIQKVPWLPVLRPGWRYIRKKGESESIYIIVAFSDWKPVPLLPGLVYRGMGGGQDLVDNEPDNCVGYGRDGKEIAQDFRRKTQHKNKGGICCFFKKFAKWAFAKSR